MHKNRINSLILILSASLLVSCSTDSQNSSYYRSSSADNNLVPTPTAVVYAPANVTIYDADKTPTGSVEEITTVQIDLYNEYGIMRQQAQLNQILKEQACSVGGNAVVLVDNQDKKHCTAKIVQTKPASISTTTGESPTSTSAASTESATK